jgi:hypothetical protein
MKACEECSECCRLLAIQMEGYYTPQGHWCKYCTQPGCSIYNTSIPKSCKDYFCGWIQNENIPDEYKPNLSGIVLEVLDNNPNTTKFWIDEKNFDNTNVVAKKLEQYTQRKYTQIYNGE